MIESYFCEKCGCKRPCEERQTPRTITVESTPPYKSRTFSYNEIQLICIVCGEEVYAPIINDANVAARLNAYHNVNTICEVKP